MCHGPRAFSRIRSGSAIQSRRGSLTSRAARILLSPPACRLVQGAAPPQSSSYLALRRYSRSIHLLESARLPAAYGRSDGDKDWPRELRPPAAAALRPVLGRMEAAPQVVGTLELWT